MGGDLILSCLVCLFLLCSNWFKYCSTVFMCTLLLDLVQTFIVQIKVCLICKCKSVPDLIQIPFFQVLYLHLLLLGLPALPLPQFLLRPNSLFSPAAVPSSFSPFPPQLIFPSSTSPLLYQAAVSPRARCSSCDCSSDFGCSYNCDKCPALCKVRLSKYSRQKTG